MKKLFFPIFLLSGVTVVSGIRIYQSGIGEETKILFISEILHMIMIAILFIMGIIYGVKRIRSKEEGFPEDDELSKKIIRKSAGISFYVTLFIWLTLLFVNSFIELDSRLIFSYGFIGMSLTFVITWLIINSQGIKDA
ncbi:MAG: hypothetical protein U9O95_03410 [Candidatus Marinimicrobia bacterium]|nr:hypothetical protein [Candidatus Neomarinimicrobiota bacterium]